MGQPIDNRKVEMFRDHLEDLPDIVLPEGFSIRPYTAGDEQHWLNIHLVADKFNELGLETFNISFHADCAALKHRQFYLVAPDGEVIGTSTAWYDDKYNNRDWGRIHWVALLPEYQGKKLAVPLLNKTCQRLRELNHSAAYLTTASARIPAINLYLKFGFKPFIRKPSHVMSWKEIEKKLKYPIQIPEVVNDISGEAHKL